MSTPGDLKDIRDNLASLNEIVAELAAAVGETEWAQVVRDTLREHNHALGYMFQGEPPRD